MSFLLRKLWLAPAALCWGAGALVASAAEPPPAWRCLSAMAWQREQEFQKPANEEQAFRNGPFDLPVIPDPGPRAAFLPWVVTGVSAEVKARLVEGVRHLHALDDTAAERCFRDAARLDAKCAAAWLGLAIANEKLPSRALYFLDQGATAAEGSPEAAWYSLYRAFFQTVQPRDLSDRLNTLADGIEATQKTGKPLPGALAMALRYRMLASHVSGLPVKNLEAADAQLLAWTKLPGGDILLPYTVLLWTKTDPARASARVEALVQKWPQPAMQRLAADPLLAAGNLPGAMSHLEAAYQAKEPYQAVALETPGQIQQKWDRGAALAWTLYHSGAAASALDTASSLLGQARKPGFTGLEAVDDDPYGIYLEGVKLRAQLMMATGDWAGLAAWMQEITTNSDGLVQKLHSQYFGMLAAAGSGQREALVKLRPALKQTADLVQATPYLNRHGPLAIRMVRGADAFADLCQGRVSPFLKDVVDVPAVVLAPKVAAAGAKDGAIAMLEEALVKQPGSKPVLAALESLKTSSTAQTSAAGTDAAAAAVEAKNGTLAPLAPALALPDKNGSIVDLTAYRGRPVLVIFFLGGGCPHCVEQLQKFRPHVPSYHLAGISLLTISTDPVSDLALTLGGKSELDPDLPFQILSDSGLGTFKAWKCHDDFLNKPMHGTFLLDGEGRVLWSDISHDPYVQAGYLLGECRRLLKVGGG
ncbi:redoxin domain-containing protein [Verrucomicrobium sp. BvORR034]|uniref:redoxin domain-containing protein n=1 Tax=Verrucomicrobium sp. BvORR034 TaxID=1396418 RepID=UPI000679A940|nr:redoxin domain-containing protein [Verrucomicrobium sp. BvORR034]